MRATTSAEDLVLAMMKRATRARVKMYRSSTWVDLTDLEGANWLRSVQIKDDVDKPAMTLKIELQRALFHLTLAPLVDGSKLNSAGTLVDLKRLTVVEFATVPIDVEPASGDWHEVFRGHVHKVNWAKPVIEVNCRDQGGVLMDTWIETQRVYGDASGVRLELVLQDILDDNNENVDVIAANLTWNGTTTVTTSDTSEAIVGDYIGYGAAPMFKVTAVSAGVSFTISNPNSVTIPTGSGAGNSIVIPNANGERVTLYVENGDASDPLYRNGGTWDDSPDWMVKSFKQAKRRIMTALQDLADQIGWKVRYKWHATLGSFELMFYEPDRAKTTPDESFSEAKIQTISRLEIALDDIRNKVKVVYGVADARSSVVQQSTSSIAKYGLRAMEIAESSSSQIDSSTEANAMASAALADLQEPTAIAQFVLDLFWPAEIGDLYRWLANDHYFDADQDLAVVGLTHTVASGKPNTTQLIVRGKPSGGVKRWLEVEALPGLALDADELSDNAADNVSAEDAQGAIVVTYDDPRTMDPPITDWALTKCYVDTTSGFTPGASNLRAVGRQTRFEVGGLVPGETYYVKLEIIDLAGNVSTISSQVTAVALKTGPYHTNNATQWDILVRNSDFGAWTQSDMPDFWTTDLLESYYTQVTGVDGATGGSVVRIYTNYTGPISPMLTSGRIPFHEGDVIEAGIRFYTAGVSVNVIFSIKTYDASGALVQTESVSGVSSDTSFVQRTLSKFETDTDTAEFEVIVQVASSSGATYVYLDRAWAVRGMAEDYGTGGESYTASSEVTVDIDSVAGGLAGSISNGIFTCEIPGTYLFRIETNLDVSVSTVATLKLEHDDGGGYSTVAQTNQTIEPTYKTMAVSHVIFLEEGDLIRVRFQADQNCTLRTNYTFADIHQLTRGD